MASSGDPPAGSLAKSSLVEQALTSARRLETIEAAYEAWDELRRGFDRGLHRLDAELRDLDDQGSLLVGAVRHATQAPRALPADASTPEADGAQRFLAEAQARLDERHAAIQAERAELVQTFSAALTEVRTLVRERVAQRARLAPPEVHLLLRSLAGGHRILHAERLSPEAAVTLFWALSQRIPSRYDALFDDSTDDVGLDPPTLYADHGVPADRVRPTAGELKAILAAQPEVWPLKGLIAQPLTEPGAPVCLVRWVQRGPVLEAEIEDGDGFRNVLSAQEAERVTGALLALKLAGQLSLSLGRG